MNRPRQRWKGPREIRRSGLAGRWLRILGLVAALAMVEPAAGNAAASSWVGDAHAAVRLITAVEGTGSSGRLDAGLQIRLAPDWHAYWRSPGEAGFPPSVDWSGSVNVATATIAWPAPRRFSLYGLQTYGYEDEVVLPVTIALQRPGEAVLLRAAVSYAACARICVPYSANLTLAVPAGVAAPGQEAQLVSKYLARVPGDAASAGVTVLSITGGGRPDAAVLRVRLVAARSLVAPDLFIEGLPHGSPGEPRIDLTDGGRSAVVAVPVSGLAPSEIVGRRLTLTLVDGDRAAELVAEPTPAPPDEDAAPDLLAIIAIALLGGLILNVMPCVLPVLSLKLLSVAQSSGMERRQVRTGFVATALGILASFLLLAGGLILVRAAGGAIGWGIQFQQPWFLVAMVVLLVLFGASLWDWLSIDLPQPVYRIAGGPSRHPIANAFLTGCFATLLATPCSAPFVGTAVGFALARGPLEIVSVFAVMALGMAMPYLVIAAMPGLAHLMPKPGRWMITLRRLLGVALAGTALWLLTVMAAIAGTGAAIMAAAAMVIVVLLLAGRRYLGERLPASRRLLAAAAVAAIAAAFLAPIITAQRPAAQAEAAVGWQSFDLTNLNRLVADGKTVFVDVTAEWCLTCKVNKALVLDREPVASRLRQPGTVAMRADWTKPDPLVTAYLASFGRYGVPFDAVYGPGAPQGIPLPELLTSDSVLGALAKASNMNAVARRDQPGAASALPPVAGGRARN